MPADGMSAADRNWVRHVLIWQLCEPYSTMRVKGSLMKRGNACSRQPRIAWTADRGACHRAALRADPVAQCGLLNVSAEELIGNFLPIRHAVFGLLGREEVDAEIAFLGLERRNERGHVGMCRDVI